MGKRIKLHVPTMIDGHLHEAGEVVTLPEGVRGPHRAVTRSHDRIDYDPKNGLDANRILGKVEDVPLYTEVADAD